MSDMGHRIGRLCVQLAGGELAVRAERYGVAEPLVRVLDALRRGADPETVRGDLDAVDEGFAVHGIDGLTTGSRSYQPLPGAGGGAGGHPVLRGWVCPAPRRCVRAAEAGGEGGPPVCEALSAPLVLVEIPL
ncbi:MULTISPECIES: hypothetical protein [unclassified Streptomyces]|uniref:hypothetical protein n=1 Tax=unclassified Streptomyces TaxID=2593676 RepID=UPI001BEA2847|nr:MULTISPECIES: hypothetical protein [unclassified Streptomyces]MBT2404271.1 hypothetical protein [Streptomyces sp. ISL-21]MBT2612948.1 hypothetical protein [Streptomyces sp. ISL-87]